MSTVYSEAYWTGDYTYTRVRVDYSGTSATATLLYSRTNNWSGATTANGATFSFGGASTSFNITLYGYQEDYPVASVSFTISTSGGTYSGSTSGAHLYTFSGSVSISAQAQPPSGGFVRDPKSRWNSIANVVEVMANAVGVTNDGGASVTDLRFNVTEVPYVSGVSRLSKIISNYDSCLVSNIEHGNTDNTINLLPNKQVYVGVYAANSAGAYRYNGGSIVTVPAPFQVTVTNTGRNSATVYYATSYDAGYYPKRFEYSIDNGKTWNLIELVTTGSIVEHTYNLTGLADSTNYVLRTRVVTDAGVTECNPVKFHTLYTEPNFYSPNNSVATHTNKFYAGSNNGAQKVFKIYCSRNGRATPFFVRHMD